MPSEVIGNLSALCANAEGFSLHAGVSFAAHERAKLERLCRYITRLTLSNKRLQVNEQGLVVLEIIYKELDVTLAFCGRKNINDVRSDILVPGTF